MVHPGSVDELPAIENPSLVAWHGHYGKFFQNFVSDVYVEVGITVTAIRAQIVAYTSWSCVVALSRRPLFRNVFQPEYRTPHLSRRGADDVRQRRGNKSAAVTTERTQSRNNVSGNHIQ